MTIEILDEAQEDLTQGFPFAIYYNVEKQLVRVHAVLDCRRNPSWIRKRLKADG